MKEESNGISLPNSLESIHSPNSFSLWHDLARHGTESGTDGISIRAAIVPNRAR